ncbi:MAG: WG repeat-containing protein, partial [Pyrinomonadaceae bacterium]
YIERQPFQYGKFILKNGSEVEWRAANSTSIAIQTGSGEQLYKLNVDSGTWYRIWDGPGKEGYIDSRGRVMIKPQFDKVTDFSEDLAAVLVDDKWGYIDRKGNVVIKPRWKPNERYIDPANPFKEGIAVVVENAYWAEDGDSYLCGYIDKTGEYIIKPQLLRECRPFSEGLAWVETDERDKDGVRVYKDELNWGGFIDKKGNWAIKPELYRAGDFVNGIAMVRKYTWPEEKWYFIDKSGRTIPDNEAIDRQKALKTDSTSKPELTLKMLKLLNISERPNSRNIYGYENREGKYVWLSPNAENHLDKDWIKGNYIGEPTK